MTNLGRVNSPTTRCLAPRTCKSSAKAGRLRPMALDRCGLHAVAHSAAHWLKYPRARIIHTPSMGGRLRFYCPGGHRTGQWRGPRRSRVPPRRTRAAFLPKCGTAGILFNLRILVRAVLCLFGRRRRRRCAAAASGRCAGASLAAATAGIAAAVGQVAPDSASHCRTWASTALQRSWLVGKGGGARHGNAAAATVEAVISVVLALRLIAPPPLLCIPHRGLLVEGTSYGRAPVVWGGG